MKVIKIARPKKEEKPKWYRTPPKPTKVVDRTKQTNKAEFAKKMRDNPTPTEKIMLDLLTQHGIKFKCQVVMFGYIVDFYFKRAKSILEVDGLIHAKREAYDEHRDKVFRDNGFRVLRITAGRLLKEPTAVVDEVKAFLKRGRAKKRVAKNIARKKKVTRWQNVPKLSKNHLPTI